MAEKARRSGAIARTKTHALGCLSQGAEDDDARSLSLLVRTRAHLTTAVRFLCAIVLEGAVDRADWPGVNKEIRGGGRRTRGEIGVLCFFASSFQDGQSPLFSLERSEKRTSLRRPRAGLPAPAPRRRGGTRVVAQLARRAADAILEQEGRGKGKREREKRKVSRVGGPGRQRK